MITCTDIFRHPLVQQNPLSIVMGSHNSTHLRAEASSTLSSFTASTATHTIHGPARKIRRSGHTVYCPKQSKNRELGSWSTATMRTLRRSRTVPRKIRYTIMPKPWSQGLQPIDGYEKPVKDLSSSSPIRLEASLSNEP